MTQPQPQPQQQQQQQQDDKRPLFTFAVIADVQYADKDDGGFEGRAQRFREAPAKLAAAVDAIVAEHAALRATAGDDAAGGGGLAALVQLGDAVDGYPESEPVAAERAAADLALVMGHLNRARAAGMPLLPVFGNHCFAAAQGGDRAALAAALGMPVGAGAGKGAAAAAAAASAPCVGFYSAPLAPGWRFIALDTTDVSLFGHGGGDGGNSDGGAADALPPLPVGSGGGAADEMPAGAAAAARWLEAHPLTAHPEAQTWNGGPSDAQLRWLRGELAAAAMAGERIIVACHHPLHAGGAAPAHYLAWRHAEVRAALEDERWPGVVALALAGHYHPGGAATTPAGVHYVTLEGLVEAPRGSNAYALVDVYGDRICVRGFGAATSRELPLRCCAGAGKGRA